MDSQDLILNFCSRSGHSKRSEMAAYLRESIVGGKLSAGTKLPPTLDLAKAWRTHGPAVQAAMAALVGTASASVIHQDSFVGPPIWTGQCQPLITEPAPCGQMAMLTRLATAPGRGHSVAAYLELSKGITMTPRKMGLAVIISAGMFLACTVCARPAAAAPHAHEWVVARSIGLSPSSSGNKKTREPAGKMHTAKMRWWRKARFGMFIHWGLYSVPAGVWLGKHVREPGEWIKNNAHIPNKQYNALAKNFDPVDFNASQWVKIAREAGMKYIVITSKHHDGFCMFNTQATNFNIVKATPWHKDPLAMLSAACRQQGIKFCTYYSIMDWHSRDQLPFHASATHPTYSPTHFAPGRGPAYLHYMERQIHELITQYHTHLLWFDGQWMHGWNKTYSHKLYNYIRSIDPTIIINARIGSGYGDYSTPEQHIPVQGLPGPWETCMTINNTWGYVSWDHDWKSSTMLIRHLIHCASGGGNFLLNVGPTAKGVIPKPEVDRLLAIGKWLKVNGKAIYGSHRTPFAKALPFGYATQKPGQLFLEVIHWPKNRTLVVPMSNRITKAYLLAKPYNTLQTATGSGGQLVYLPATAPDPVASVVVLDIKGKVEPKTKILSK